MRDTVRTACKMQASTVLASYCHRVLSCLCAIQQVTLPAKATTDAGAGLQEQKVQASKTLNYTSSAALSANFLPVAHHKAKMFKLQNASKSKELPQSREDQQPGHDSPLVWEAAHPGWHLLAPNMSVPKQRLLCKDKLQLHGTLTDPPPGTSALPSFHGRVQ